VRVGFGVVELLLGVGYGLAFDMHCDTEFRGLMGLKDAGMDAQAYITSWDFERN
jgi:hypothetical protein